LIDVLLALLFFRLYFWLFFLFFLPLAFLRAFRRCAIARRIARVAFARGGFARFAFSGVRLWRRHALAALLWRVVLDRQGLERRPLVLVMRVIPPRIVADINHGDVVPPHVQHRHQAPFTVILNLIMFVRMFVDPRRLPAEYLMDLAG